MHLPSKNIVFLFIACTLSISLIIWAKQSAPINKQINLEAVTATSTDDTTYLNPEEKSALGLGDQTPFTIKTTSTSTSKEPNTLTNSFSKDVFSKYLQAQSGGAVDSQTKDALVNSTISKYSSVQLIPDKYTKTDLQTSSSLDNEKTKQYANLFISTEDEGLRVVEALSQNVGDDTSNIPLIAASYKNLAKNLSNLFVPEALAEVHLGIINNYYRLGESLLELQTSQNDPAKLLLLLKDQQSSQDERVMYYSQIATFIKNSGIIFGNSEPGRFWLANQ